MESGFAPEKKFASPEEELQFLREKVAMREAELIKAGKDPRKEGGREEIVKGEVQAYSSAPTEKVLDKKMAMSSVEVEAVTLDLAPEAHDATMAELISILVEKGVKNALAVVERLNSPHIEDDFHRFLIEYIKEGHPVAGLKEGTPLFKIFHMTLYEISLPEPELAVGDKTRPIKELISGMEQFYAGMLSAFGEKSESGRNVVALEIANANYSEEVVFYAAVPSDKKDLFEKHILSIFPHAKIIEKKDDYNIFNEKGAYAGSVAVTGRNPIFPIKTYDVFDYDPLNSVLNSFSKIDKEGEGAAIQLIFTSAGDHYGKNYKQALENIRKGTPVKKAIDIPDSFGSEAAKFGKELVKGVFGDIMGHDKKKKEEEEKKPKPIDEMAIKLIEEKIATPIVRTNIRILASSTSENEAEDILSDIESSFNQFDNTQGNKLIFRRVKKSKLRDLARDFSFRTFDSGISIPLNFRETTSLVHFPVQPTKSSPHLRQAKAGTAPAPIDLPKAGTLLGLNINRNIKTEVYITDEDRLRHFYTIGQTGTGKSTLLKNMIAQDILAGKGVCMIDPHGIDIQDILSIIPKERTEDVIYFDPSYTEKPMALNMLEYDQKYPEQKTFVVNELFSIFQKLYGAVPESMGPMFEQYFRNATMLVIEDPETGGTLLDVSRVMADKAFRTLKLSRCKNPVVVQFWREVAEKAGGEAALANIVPYITSKFDVFLANDIMRPIVAQEKSSFNFRDIMDNKKILLVNLAKGRLGDINANLIGLILVGKILMAALSRVDSFGKDMPTFYLYIDEFQNVTTNSISTILSEARKYKLSLNVAHQFIAQLDEKIRDSVFGNIGSIAAFRVGAEDAEYLEKQFTPTFTAHDLMNVDNRNAFVKMLANGKPIKPFNIETLSPPQGDSRRINALKELSYLTYGGDRAEIEEAILKKYNKKTI